MPINPENNPHENREEAVKLFVSAISAVPDFRKGNADFAITFADSIVSGADKLLNYILNASIPKEQPTEETPTKKVHNKK